MIFLSVLGGLRGSDFFQFWVFLELNLIGFVVFGCLRNSPGSGGGLIEYFLVQGFYSCLVILLYLHYPLIFSLRSFLVVRVLILKLGVAPFHR